LIKYLLDTNICIFIIKKKPIEVINKLRKLIIEDVGISTITISEMEYGVSKSNRKEENKFSLAEFLAPFEIVHYDDNAAKHYGEIRAELEKQGNIIGGMDLLLAAQALASNAILVTNNTKEFKRINGLKIEDWVN
jgi:tRNA(fMet)-specific endonuclease VapC